MEEPQSKRPKVDPEENAASSSSKEEEEEGNDCATEYKLFVAVKNIEDEEKKDPKKADEAEEEDLGSEDSDDGDEDDDNEEEDGFVVYEWEDLHFGADVLDKVKKMSYSLYDHSEEGFQEIEEAASASAPPAEDSKEKEAKSEDVVTLANVAVGGMLVLKVCKDKEAAEITQVFIDPEHRDNGIGKELALVALEFAKNDCGAKHVDVFAVGGSAPFYKKLGFKYVSNEKGDSTDLPEGKSDSEEPERCILRFDLSEITLEGSNEEDKEEEDDDDDDDDDDEDSSSDENGEDSSESDGDDSDSEDSDSDDDNDKK